MSCLDCGDLEEIRQFFVVPVQRTNLVLVVVEHFSEKAIFQYTKKNYGIPAQPVESILYLILLYIHFKPLVMIGQKLC